MDPPNMQHHAIQLALGRRGGPKMAESVHLRRCGSYGKRAMHESQIHLPFSVACEILGVRDSRSILRNHAHLAGAIGRERGNDPYKPFNWFLLQTNTKTVHSLIP